MHFNINLDCERRQTATKKYEKICYWKKLPFFYISETEFFLSDAFKVLAGSLCN